MSWCEHLHQIQGSTNNTFPAQMHPYPKNHTHHSWNHTQTKENPSQHNKMVVQQEKHSEEKVMMQCNKEKMVVVQRDITHNNNNLTLNCTQSLKHTTTTICHPFVQTLHTFHNNTLPMSNVILQLYIDGHTCGIGSRKIHANGTLTLVLHTNSMGILLNHDVMLCSFVPNPGMCSTYTTLDIVPIFNSWHIIHNILPAMLLCVS